MMEQWEENEYILMAMFQKESRQKTMEEIRGMLPFIKEDEEMQVLAESTLEKMSHMTDREFLSMDLEPYQTEPEEGQWIFVSMQSEDRKELSLWNMM